MHTAISHAIFRSIVDDSPRRSRIIVLKRKRSHPLSPRSQRRILLLSLSKKIFSSFLVPPSSPSLLLLLLLVLLSRVSRVVHGALLRSEFNFRRDRAVS